jgi:hypothetical protein
MFLRRCNACILYISFGSTNSFFNCLCTGGCYAYASSGGNAYAGGYTDAKCNSCFNTDAGGNAYASSGGNAYASSGGNTDTPRNDSLNTNADTCFNSQCYSCTTATVLCNKRWYLPCRLCSL